MQALWSCGEWVSVVEIQEELLKEGKRLALPSIRTMLNILQEKGAVTRQGQGRRHLYHALVSEESSQSSIVGELLEKAFHNNAGSLVAALLNLDQISEGDLEKARAMLDAHTSGKKKEDAE